MRVRQATMRLISLAVLCAAGALLAAGIGAGQRVAQTTTETTTTTTTEPATTVVSTSTVEHTTTRRVVVPTSTTSSTSNDNTPAWVWVLIGILAGGLVLLVVLLARRGGSPPAAGQQRRLDGAIATWAAQGWGLESQTTDSAILRRGNDRMLVSVDDAGHVSTRDLPAY
jgi:hypothetical protein